MTLAGMLTAVQQEFERAAARRVDENNALRSLISDAASVVTDGDLSHRLSDAAIQSQPSLLVSDLERDNNGLRSLLIELHAHIESIDSPEARRIEEAIWKELVTSTERRRLTLDRF
jgi:hypothetical protein